MKTDVPTLINIVLSLNDIVQILPTFVNNLVPTTINYIVPTLLNYAIPAHRNDMVPTQINILSTHQQLCSMNTSLWFGKMGQLR